MKAVDKFDHTSDLLSTYATWYLLAITRAIADQARTIRDPCSHGGNYNVGS